MNNEDIKVLEEYLDKQDRKFVSEYRLALLQAIENLIKGYKELEEKNIKLQKRNNRQFKLFGKRDKEIENLKNANKTLYELCQGKAMQEFINNECDYIPKSKVREKIEELEKDYQEYKDSQEWEIFDETKYAYELLQELLEERN